MSEQGPTEPPEARMREIDGELVLDDPMAVMLARAVGKQNCQRTLEINADRMAHFKDRVHERELTHQDVVLTIINADDPNGKILADVLMPDHDWQAYRNRGEVPFARGLASTEGVQHFLNAIDEEAAAKLKDATDLSIVVIDHGVAEVFPADS